METLRRATNSTYPLFSLSGKLFKGKIVNVYDADTCKIVLDRGNDKLHKFCCRLMGIDTPEMKPSRSNANRDAEKEAAFRARNRFIQVATSCQIDLDDRSKRSALQTLIDTNEKIIDIQCLEFDKYGRLLVNLFENMEEASIGNSYNNLLISEGYAYAYDGGTKKKFKQ
jgi:endonuclease YncB( thermonuclease family)